MSLLNRPSDGLLSVLLALRRAILAYGSQTEEKLIALCSPPSVTGTSDMSRKTLTRWKQLGFFRVSSGKVSLNSDVEKVDADDLDALRATVLRLVLDASNNPELATEHRPASDENEASLASDFIRAACWALAQEPYSFPGTWTGVEKLQNEQAVAPRPFANDTRWQGFSEWATFLGIAWRAVAPARLILDPSFAINAFLGNIFVEERVLDHTSFLTRLAQHLPVIDGGSFRLVVEQQIQKPAYSLRPNEISQCLSMALLHLEQQGRIGLEARADAPQKMMLGRDSRELRSFSHVTFEKRI